MSGSIGYDFLALNSYSNTADSMYIDPKTGKVKSSDQAAMNQDLHYDTALTAPQDYLSPADIGAGADALAGDDRRLEARPQRSSGVGRAQCGRTVGILYCD